MESISVCVRARLCIFKRITVFFSFLHTAITNTYSYIWIVYLHWSAKWMVFRVFSCERAYSFFHQNTVSKCWHEKNPHIWCNGAFKSIQQACCGKCLCKSFAFGRAKRAFIVCLQCSNLCMAWHYIVCAISAIMNSRTCTVFAATYRFLLIQNFWIDLCKQNSTATFSNLEYSLDASHLLSKSDAIIDTIRFADMKLPKTQGNTSRLNK